MADILDELHHATRKLEPGIRALFTRDAMLSGDWYAERLAAKQKNDVQAWTRHVRTLETFLGRTNYSGEAARLRIADRLASAKETLAAVRAPGYVGTLCGTLGVQPLQGR